MGGQEKKIVFSDLHALVHREFSKVESGKSFVSTPISKDILFLLGRVINFPKDDLSLLYFWASLYPVKITRFPYNHKYFS